MKTLFKAVLIYGIASAVVAWFGLLFITIANLVFALAGAISMGVNIFQNVAAGIILLLLTILLFFGMKLLFGVAKSGMAMAKAMGSAGKLGMPKGGVGNMLKGLGRLNPRSLRDAGNMANKLGGRKAGKLLNKGADMKSGLDEARELKKISDKKNTGKISKKKQKELAAAKSKRNNDLDRASKDKKYRDKVKSSMLFDNDGQKKTGEELSKAEKEANKFDLDAQRAGKFRELFPELGERMYADEINDLLDGELPNYDKRRLGIGDDKMGDIATRMERGHFTDGLGVNTDNDYKKIAEETGGIANEHKSVDATDSKELQEKNEETRAHDEKSTEIANRLNESHSEEKEANSDTPGEDTSQKAMNVSQTVNEHKNATLNGSENSNSPDAVISDPEKEKDIASGANDLPVDKSTAEDNARRTSVEIDNLTSSAPGMPEGTTIDENGESLRNQLMSRDEDGNIISSIEDDEITRAGETAARGDAIHGTVLPKEVTDSGDFSDENIERATSGNTQEYISGMDDQSVADALNDREVSGTTGSDNVSDIVGDQSAPSTSQDNVQDNVNDILSTDSTSSMSSDDLMSSIDESDRETVESPRGASTAASSLQQENIGLPSSMDTTEDSQNLSSVDDVIGAPADQSFSSATGQPVSGSTDQSTPADQSFSSDTGQPVSGSTDQSAPADQSFSSATGQPVSGSTDQSDPIASDQSFDNNSAQSDDPVTNAFQTLQRNRQQYEQNQQGNAQAPDSDQFMDDTERQGDQSFDNNSAQSDDPVTNAFETMQRNRQQYEQNQQGNAQAPDSDQFMDDTERQGDQSFDNNSVQSDDPVTNAFQTMQRNRQQYEQNQQGNAQAPGSDQFMDDTERQGDLGDNVMRDAPSEGQAGFVQTNYGASGRESVGSDQGASIPQQGQNVSDFTETQPSQSISSDDVIGSVNQGTPEYIDRPTQQNQYGPTEKYLTYHEDTRSDQEIAYAQGSSHDEVGPTMDPLYSDNYYENREAKPETIGEWNQAAFIQDYQNNNPNVAPQQPNVVPQQPVVDNTQQFTGEVPSQGGQQSNVAPQQPNVAPQQPNVAPQQPVVDNTQQFTGEVPSQGGQQYTGPIPQQPNVTPQQPVVDNTQQFTGEVPSQPNVAPQQPVVDNTQQFTGEVPSQGGQQYTGPIPQQRDAYDQQPQPSHDNPIAPTQQPNGQESYSQPNVAPQQPVQQPNVAPQQPVQQPNVAPQQPVQQPNVAPQQPVTDPPEQANTNEDIMNSIIGDQQQTQPSRETPIAPSQQVNGQVPQAQPVSGSGYTNIPQNPLVNNDGFYGDRDVRLSPESMFLMGQVLDNAGQDRDANLRRDMSEMNRRTEGRISSQLDQLSHQFEDDLRESGKYTEDEIRGEVAGMSEAFKRAMERKDDFADEQDQAKMTGNMTNQGNTGKVKRPDNR